MNNQNLHKILTYLIAAVWIINGLICKILNLVPRHQQIVANILSEEHARLLTILIGISEIIIAVWIISRYESKINAIIQIAIVAIMNTLEFILVPELLLWGRLNSLFAFAFIIIVWYNEIKLPNKPLANKSS